LADFVNTHLPGAALAVEEDEPFDDSDVSLLRADARMLEPDVVAHPFEGDRFTPTPEGRKQAETYITFIEQWNAVLKTVCGNFSGNRQESSNVKVAFVSGGPNNSFNRTRH